MNEPQAPQPDAPQEGQIYERDGRSFLFVRSEHRPGSDHVEYLYVGAWDRMAHTHWTTEPLPMADLIVDRDGRQQAKDQATETFIARYENWLLVDLLKTACDWLPPQRARDLRQEYVNRKAVIA